MSSYNKTVIIGNAGKDAEMKYTPSGTAVTTFSVAVNEGYTNKEGVKIEKVTWFRVTAWNKLAEVCNQYVTKGKQVLVEGTVDTHAWIDANSGEARSSLELRADTVKFLGSKATGDEHSNPGSPVVTEEEIPF